MRRGHTFFGFASITVVVAALAGMPRHPAAEREAELRTLRAQEAEIKADMQADWDERYAAFLRWQHAGEQGPMPALVQTGAASKELGHIQLRIVELEDQAR